MASLPSILVRNAKLPIRFETDNGIWDHVRSRSQPLCLTDKFGNCYQYAISMSGTRDRIVFKRPGKTIAEGKCLTLVGKYNCTISSSISLRDRQNSRQVRDVFLWVMGRLARCSL